MADANIKAVITADDRASGVLKNFGNHVDSVGGKIGAVAKTAGIALAAAGAAAIGFGVLSVKAYMESENALAQLQATLKSTNNVAGVTSDQAVKLASSFQKVTKFSDEAILGGENLLLTFTSIGKDIFPQATETMLNMSQALGQDLKGSAIQLGKALQDPIRGVTALRRVGVNFNQSQVDTIQKLVDSNRLLDAQKLILKELQTEFGGSAVAAGTTFGGQLTILKNQLNDVEESAGKTIVNALIPFATKAAEFVNSIDWQAVIDRSSAALRNLGTDIMNTYHAVADYITPGISRLIEIVVSVAKTLDDFFMPSLRALWSTLSDRLLPQLKQLWNTLEPGLTDALKVIAVVLGALVVAALWITINVLNVFISVLGGGIRIISNIISWLGNLGGVAINTANTIAGAFKAAFNAVAYFWNSTVGKIGFTVPNWIPGLGGKHFDVPDIPTLAEGGIVTKPTLAMIGEAGREAVIPLDRAGGIGGNISLNVNIGMYAGSEVEKRKVAQALLQALQDSAASKNTSIGEMMGLNP